MNGITPIGDGSIPWNRQLITVFPASAIRATPSGSSRSSSSFTDSTAAMRSSSSAPGEVPTWLIRVITLSPNRLCRLKQVASRTISPLQSFTAATVVVPRSTAITLSRLSGSGRLRHAAATLPCRTASERSGISTSPSGPVRRVRQALTSAGTDTGLPSVSHSPERRRTRQRPQVPLPPQRRSSG